MVDITVKSLPRIILVKVSGVIDAPASRQLHQVLMPLLESGPARRLAIDLAQVPCLTSAGLQVLLAVCRRLDRRNSLVVCRPAPGIRRLLQLTGLTRLVMLSPDPDRAGPGMAPKTAHTLISP